MYQGVLRKMSTVFESPIKYTLQLDHHLINVNELLGKEVRLELVGYECLNCSSSRKTYRMGHCYDCFYQIPQTADWIIRPELSKAHLGIEDRDLAFEKEVQLAPHIVYLALSSNAKVGVTRKTQVPTRWIDQGAVAAIPIVETPNRYLAGIAEVALKNHVADKTNWRKMLKNENDQINLFDLRTSLIDFLPHEVHPYILNQDSDLYAIDYPVTRYPDKIVSLNLEKKGAYSGQLSGIKGQYLIFNDNTVFNIRGNEGQVVNLSWRDASPTLF